MKPKPIFKLFSLKGIGQTPIPRPVSTLVITLAVLSLFVLTACVQAPASAPGVEESSPAVAAAAVTEEEIARTSAYLSAYLAESPTLLKVRPPTDAQEMTGSEFLAANPELNVVRRYTGVIENEGSRPDTYDIEALRAQSYAAFREKNSLDAFLDANPELRFARGRLATAIEEGEASANPELSEKLARRRMMTGVDSTFLAANPELSSARRYATMTDWRRHHFPGR